MACLGIERALFTYLHKDASPHSKESFSDASPIDCTLRVRGTGMLELESQHMDVAIILHQDTKAGKTLV